MAVANDYPYNLASYEYDLPPEMIAQTPVDPRDGSRLMVLDTATGAVRHAVFREIGQFLRNGDLLVLNNTKVFPARTLGRRATGGKVEVLFIRECAPDHWEVMARCNGRLRPGERLLLEDGRLTVHLVENTPQGDWIAHLPDGTNLPALLDKVGRVPLPPYIRRAEEHQRDARDKARYQTVYARSTGAVAAPTAGLHFTKRLLHELARRNITTAEITLHVGPGTFRPIKTRDLRQHSMHAEFYAISQDTANRIIEAKASGRRVIAAGTTTCRALEAAAAAPRGLAATEAWTKLYIYPPYTFRVVDGLVTNFHLPRSSLLLLVSAFAGRERVLRAYDVARREGYRFYSYGDAMLIVKT